MTKALFLAPTARGVGLTSICVGLVRALDELGLRVAFCKPIAHLSETSKEHDRSTAIIHSTTHLTPPSPISQDYAFDCLSKDDSELLMEQVVGLYQNTLSQYSSGFSDHQEAEIVVVEGISSSDDEATHQLNRLMAKTLDAEVILVGSPAAKSLHQLNDELTLTASYYGGSQSDKVIGAILNMVNAPTDRAGVIRIDLLNPAEKPQLTNENIQSCCSIFHSDAFHLIGSIPWEIEQTAARTQDVYQYLGAQPLNEVEINQRRIRHVVIAAQSVNGFVKQFKAGALIFTPHDREDIIAAAALASSNGFDLAGVILTGTHSDEDRSPAILDWCHPAQGTDLPIAWVDMDVYHAATVLARFTNKVPVDDAERIEVIMSRVAHFLDKEWLKERISRNRPRMLTPAAFRYDIVQRARKAKRTIVLPEGDEPRTIKAAAICAERQIANTILLGNRESIEQQAKANGVTLPDGVEIRDPATFRESYVPELLRLRKHKGLSEERALQALEDNVVVGTMMVVEDQVDGLVSGAVHTTANTIRPALQLIRTKPDARLVSSIFFMCLPDQVLIYGDCAINPDPTAEELADIAIQSALSAIAFGIEPRVAMISYSTGSSGHGADVDKVRSATEIVKEKRPDLLVDGPLQYDAALIPSVGKAKAPNSPVAGQANVLIFPDLNTGNTTYKAVQRSANVISIGPMLQGLNKPVNDLSRGALVDDIVYTIAITAIQSAQAESLKD